MIDIEYWEWEEWLQFIFQVLFYVILITVLVCLIVGIVKSILWEKERQKIWIKKINEERCSRKFETIEITKEQAKELGVDVEDE